MDESWLWTANYLLSFPPPSSSVRLRITPNTLFYSRPEGTNFVIQENFIISEVKEVMNEMFDFVNQDFIIRLT